MDNGFKEENIQLCVEVQDRHGPLDRGLLWCNHSLKKTLSCHFNNLTKSKFFTVANILLDNLAPIPFPSSPRISLV